MTNIASTETGGTRRWPMTNEARAALVDEVAELRSDVAALAGAPPADGAVRLPVTQAPRRLETLELVLAGAEVVDEVDRAVIGRLVELRVDDEETVQYRIVFPGDGDPGNGWISADSPLGAAIVGARPGDTVDVAAPVGRWRATVVGVS